MPKVMWGLANAVEYVSYLN